MPLSCIWTRARCNCCAATRRLGSDHYIVVRAAGPPGRRIIFYDYIASRTKEALKQLFVGPDGSRIGASSSAMGWSAMTILHGAEAAAFWLFATLRTMFFKARKVSQLPCSRTLANAAIVDYLRPVFRSRNGSRRYGKSMRRGGKFCLWRRYGHCARRSQNRSWRSSRHGSMICCPVRRRTARSARRLVIPAVSGQSW